MSSVREDMTLHIGRQLEEVLERNMRVAAVAIPGTDLVFMNIQIATAIGMMAIGQAVANRKPEIDPETFYDTVAETLFANVRKGKAEVLRQIREQRA